MKEYPKLMTPVVGQAYHNRGGFDCRCESLVGPGEAVMVRVSDGWTVVAHGVRQYTNGDIEWDQSTGGHWPSR